ncbi:MAG: 2-amino-4-hydroxy-6-hydroxymethyldihydropteridine diphosphokinase, partial [Geminicoccaceae bacterium]
MAKPKAGTKRQAGAEPAPGEPRRVVIGLGANLGDRATTLEHAVRLLGEQVGEVVARSGWMASPALIHPSDPAGWHPPFLNGAVLIRSKLDPLAILERLHAIERRLGRDRTRDLKWQPRIIDLDVIAIEDRVIDRPELMVPHPEMQKRDFVLLPMLEVWPDWVHPL